MVVEQDQVDTMLVISGASLLLRFSLLAILRF